MTPCPNSTARAGDTSDRSDAGDTNRAGDEATVANAGQLGIAAPQRAVAIGSTIARYAVLETVGTGAMGTVVRAYDPKLRREVALKRLRTAAKFTRRAIISHDPADTFLNCAIAMESLLVKGKDMVSARVSDAVSLRLARSFAERETLRDTVRNIYDIRSGVVHDGEYRGSEAERLHALGILRRILAAELRLGE